MRKKLYVYCDMDGVLADFDGAQNALNRFKTEKGFFAGLFPIPENIQGLKQLLNNKHIKVRILSASPNEQADKDKRFWLSLWLPEIDGKDIIICRVGQNKSKFMKTKKGLLFDDWGKNIEQWLEVDGNDARQIGCTYSILDFAKEWQD